MQSKKTFSPSTQTLVCIMTSACVESVWWAFQPPLYLISPHKAGVWWTRRSAERDESPITAHVRDAAIFKRRKYHETLNFSSAADPLYVKPLCHEKCRAQRAISQVHRRGEPDRRSAAKSDLFCVICQRATEPPSDLFLFLSFPFFPFPHIFLFFFLRARLI